MAGYLSQPKTQVRTGLDAAKAAVKLQEDVLRNVFRRGRALEEMQSHAVDHCLVLAHDLGEGRMVAIGASRERSINDLFGDSAQMPFPSILYYANGAGDGAIFFREQVDSVREASKQRAFSVV